MSTSIPMTMVAFWLAIFPLAVFGMLWMQTANVTIEKSYEQELKACQADNTNIVAQRDVYCVQTYGKPNPFFLYVLPVILTACGLFFYFIGSRKLMTENAEIKTQQRTMMARSNALDKKALALQQLEDRLKEKGVVMDKIHKLKDTVKEK